MAVVQRPLKGSRLSSFYPVKSLPALSSLDSAFQLQEYISLLIRLDVHDVERIVSIPGKSTSAQDASDEKDTDKDTKGDVTVDEACWIYEQLRRLGQDLSHPLITTLQQECTRQSCPEMKAGEWLYLCVAHGNDGAMEQCCAIDYIIHTLDSATALLNSPRAFPSRLSIPASSYRHFSSLARRLGRIFAHAYFHHREAFEQAEAESSLYARFLTLTSKFDLVPSEFLVIPPRLGHPEDSEHGAEVEPPRLLAAAVDPRGDRAKLNERFESQDQPGNNLIMSIGRDTLSEGERRSSPLSPGDTSRKLGRSRTDTMVFSEAVSIAEDLARMEELEQTNVSLPPIETQEPAVESPMEPEPVPAPTEEPEEEEEVQEEVPEPEIISEEEAVEPEHPAPAVTEPEKEDHQETSEPPASEEIAEPESEPVPHHAELDEGVPKPGSTEDEQVDEVEPEETGGSDSDEEDTADEVPEPKQNTEDASATLAVEDEGDVSISVGDASVLEVEDLISEQSFTEEGDSVVLEPKSDPPDAKVTTSESNLKEESGDRVPASDAVDVQSTSVDAHKDSKEDDKPTDADADASEEKAVS